MKMLKTFGILAIALCLAGTSLLAHQVTFKGTVVSIDKTSVKVTVVDEKTKRPVQKSFDFAEEGGFRLPELALLAKPKPRAASFDFKNHTIAH